MTVEAAVRCHTLAVLAGGTPRLPVAEWLQARRMADEALATLLDAVGLGAGGLGGHVDERAAKPNPGDLDPDALPAAGGFSTRRLKADDTLLDLGYRWSASRQQWLQPARPPATPPTPCAWPEGEAADRLRTLGWEWTGERWEHLRPGPAQRDPNVRAAAQSVITAAAKSPSTAEMVAALGNLNAMLGNPPCAFLQAMEYPEARQEIAAAILLRSQGWEWEGDKWAAPGAGHPAKLPEAVSKLRGLGYEWMRDTHEWRCTKPAPSVLDQPLGVPMTIGRGTYNAYRLAHDTPVRALVEHAEGLHAKVHRQDKAMNEADLVLTMMLNKQQVPPAQIRDARNGLRER